jgi:hypothetical protein
MLAGRQPAIFANIHQHWPVKITTIDMISDYVGHHVGKSIIVDDSMCESHRQGSCANEPETG